MRSPRAPDGCSHASQSVPARTASASGRSRAATRSATPTTCARRASPLVAGIVLVLLAGCGGGHRGASGQLQQGRVVFARSCAGCHTLLGHDTEAPGGDLAIAQLRVADLRSFVRVMPVNLSSREVDAVPAYVNAVAAGKGAR